MPLIMEFRNVPSGDLDLLRHEVSVESMEDPRFAHPFYWSPFLLISNGL